MSQLLFKISNCLTIAILNLTPFFNKLFICRFYSVYVCASISQLINHLYKFSDNFY